MGGWLHETRFLAIHNSARSGPADDDQWLLERESNAGHQFGGYNQGVVRPAGRATHENGFENPLAKYYDTSNVQTV